MLNVSGLILAGGKGSRMNGADKGLVQWQGLPLIEHVLQRLAPQVDDIVISCNRNLEHYQHYGRCVSDHNPDFTGPLAGIAAGLPECQQEWVVVVACDMPFLALDLVAQLWQGRQQYPIAVAHDGHYLQPLAMLVHRSLSASMDEALAQGITSVQRWIKQQAYAEVRFADTQMFTNFNHLEDLVN